MTSVDLIKKGKPLQVVKEQARNQTRHIRTAPILFGFIPVASTIFQAPAPPGAPPIAAAGPASSTVVPISLPTIGASVYASRPEVNKLGPRTPSDERRTLPQTLQPNSFTTTGPDAYKLVSPVLPDTEVRTTRKPGTTPPRARPPPRLNAGGRARKNAQYHIRSPALQGLHPGIFSDLVAEVRNPIREWCYGTGSSSSGPRV